MIAAEGRWIVTNRVLLFGMAGQYQPGDLAACTATLKARLADGAKPVPLIMDMTQLAALPRDLHYPLQEMNSRGDNHYWIGWTFCMTCLPDTHSVFKWLG